ncbi:hypothetical protein [Ectopseudomonas oleovorans]|nr:hypothetical protein [Pseudomonas oleovorans]
MRSYLRSGGSAVQLSVSAKADLGRGRERLSRIYVINPEGKEMRPKKTPPAAPRDKGAIIASARKAADANIAARKAERDALAGAVLEAALAGKTRKLAAEELGISPNTLRRITKDHDIHFARDRSSSFIPL